MFMRTSSFALALLLVGCGESEKSNGPAPLVPQSSAQVEALAEPPKTVCAVDGAAELTPVCDGRGVIAADGAEQALVTTIGTSLIEVSVGNDRYRLPAVVQP
jgi:hypothetical protein